MFETTKAARALVSSSLVTSSLVTASLALSLACDSAGPVDVQADAAVGVEDAQDIQTDSQTYDVGDDTSDADGILDSDTQEDVGEDVQEDTGEDAQEDSGEDTGGFSNDDLDIVFAQDFTSSPLGDYSRSAWSQDWGLSESASTDPCGTDCEDPQKWARARLTIEEEDGNRFMRKVHDSFLVADASGVQWWKDIGNHEELYLSFRLRFAGDDWEGPSYHAKLPGFCGSEGCPGGGASPTYEDGFSTRYMFHDTSTLFFYLYYAAMSTQYGETVHFDPYDNSPGRWRTLTQRVVLNTPGQANGIVEAFLDGELVAQKTDMDFRNADDQYISTFIFANFLGGSGEDPADYGDEPTNDFDDFVIYRYKDHVPGIKRGLEPNEPGATIPLPR